jgi:spore coat protein U-like protein
MKPHIALLLVLGGMSSGLHAQQTATTTFKVTAKVQAVCAVTASDLGFGTYVSGGTLLQGTTVLHSTCTPNTTYNIGLDQGQAPNATINQRKMISGANSLNYQLYSDSARSRIWGNTTGTDTVTGTGTGLSQDHTVYGSVPAAQAVPAGDYQDTITVRVYY